MKHGRLVKLVFSDSDPNVPAKSSILYVVAIESGGEAVALVRNRLAREGDQVEDVGHVSLQLLNAMNLGPGEFTRA